MQAQTGPFAFDYQIQTRKVCLKDPVTFSCGMATACIPNGMESTAASVLADVHTEACPGEKHHIGKFSEEAEEDWIPV